MMLVQHTNSPVQKHPQFFEQIIFQNQKMMQMLASQRHHSSLQMRGTSLDAQLAHHHVQPGQELTTEFTTVSLA